MIAGVLGPVHRAGGAAEGFPTQAGRQFANLHPQMEGSP
jgi:hypothetical protein